MEIPISESKICVQELKRVDTKSTQVDTMSRKRI